MVHSGHYMLLNYADFSPKVFMRQFLLPNGQVQV